MIERKCFSCQILKPATTEFFHKDSNRPLGLMYKCKECAKKRKFKQKRWQDYTEEQRIKKYANQKKNYYKPSNRALHILKGYKKQDVLKSRDFDLTKEFIIQKLNEKCYYCGYETIGLDRKDNKLGHTQDNCVSSCKECNIIRMDNFTFEEMKVLGKTIKKIKDERKNSFWKRL